MTIPEHERMPSVAAEKLETGALLVNSETALKVVTNVKCQRAGLSRFFSCNVETVGATSRTETLGSSDFVVLKVAAGLKYPLKLVELSSTGVSAIATVNATFELSSLRDSGLRRCLNPITSFESDSRPTASAKVRTT